MRYFIFALGLAASLLAISSAVFAQEYVRATPALRDGQLTFILKNPTDEPLFLRRVDFPQSTDTPTGCSPASKTFAVSGVPARASAYEIPTGIKLADLAKCSAARWSADHYRIQDIAEISDSPGACHACGLQGQYGGLRSSTIPVPYAVVLTSPSVEYHFNNALFLQFVQKRAQRPVGQSSHSN